MRGVLTWMSGPTWVWDHAYIWTFSLELKNQSRLEVKDADWKTNRKLMSWICLEPCLLMKRISAHALASFLRLGAVVSQESEHWASNRSWEMERSNCHRLRNSRMVFPMRHLDCAFHCLHPKRISSSGGIDLFWRKSPGLGPKFSLDIALIVIKFQVEILFL